MRKSRALVPLFFLISGCAGSARVSASAQAEAESDASVEVAENVDAGPASELRNVDAGADAAALESESPVSPIDPEAVEAVVNKAEQSSVDAGLGLRFEVYEQGPHAPWILAVVNRGTEPVSVVFDSRLLTLEVEAPPPTPEPESDAKKKKTARPAKPPKPTLCKLPADIVPNSPDRQLQQELSPGEGLVQAFDPKLYCVPTDLKPVLLGGARVTARFGWPPKTKTVWRAGGSVKVPVEQSPPFVASPLEGAEVQAASDTGADAGAPAERRIKQLEAPPITLGEAYSAPLRKAPESDEPLVLSVLRGSDALNESTATVTVAIKNRSKESQRVFFRRELISFEVAGPEGLVDCTPTPDDRAPDRSAFTTLRPGREIRTVSRLAELCPANTFARPGLYLIHARVDFVESGARHNLTAYTGTVMSSTPASLRIRKGEAPYVPPSGAMRVRVGESS